MAIVLDGTNGISTTNSVTVGTGGDYNPGAIYSDANWGMIFRAKQSAPVTSEFLWANAEDVPRMKMGTTGALTINNQPACTASITTGWLTMLNATSYGVCSGSIQSLNQGGFYVGGAIGGYNVIHVPVNGLYEVTSNIYKGSTTTGRLNILVNNGSGVGFTHLTQTTSDCTYSTRWYMYLNAGDYLNYRLDSGNLYLYHNPLHTQISIRLVS